MVFHKVGNHSGVPSFDKLLECSQDFLLFFSIYDRKNLRIARAGEHTTAKGFAVDHPLAADDFHNGISSNAQLVKLCDELFEKNIGDDKFQFVIIHERKY